MNGIKNINIPMPEKDHQRINKLKGKKSWYEFIMELTKE